MSHQRFGVFEVDEECSLKIRTIAGDPVHDENGDAIPGGSITACTLKLYDSVSGTLLREEATLIGNGGTWDSSGNFALLLDPPDNVILDDTKAFETHVALIEFEYPIGKGKIEAVINVRNLVKVPSA